MAAMRDEMMDARHKEVVAAIKPETDVKTLACRETNEGASGKNADLNGQET
jgi:hypothetical protein